MAENMKEELILKEIDIKEEEICSSYSLEETSTWDVRKEVVKIIN